MKDLDFEKDEKKLQIIGRTKLGKAWIDTLKPSSRKIKPGSEKYVINAFVKWRKQQQTLNATNKTTIAAINLRESSLYFLISSISKYNKITIQIIKKVFDSVERPNKTENTSKTIFFIRLPCLLISA